jgi:ornithine cyclodeaminase/alanine dehydrogenase-like protein (mu-crystallin family)
MRTGAAGALGIKYLAGEGVKRVGILGTGRIARSLALACDAVFELQELRCTSRKQENRTAFAETVGPQLRAELVMVASVGECLYAVDAVLTAVPTPEPILEESDLAGIAHIAVLAGDSRTRQVAAEVLERRQVVVDVLEQAQRSGEFRWAREQGSADRIGLARGEDGAVLTIGDAACGRVGAGNSAVYLTGMGAQDLCAAVMIYEVLRNGD